MEYLMRDYSTCPFCAGTIRHRQGGSYECLDCRKLFEALDNGYSDSELRTMEISEFLEKEADLMKREEFASRIDGRQYRDELTAEDIEIARKNGLVVVFGASDDLIEFEGAIRDEGGCYDGGYVYFDRSGVAQDEEKLSNVIKAIWCGTFNGDPVEHRGDYETGEGVMIAWCYETDIPHSTFMVYEDDEPYCRGIVFSIEDIKETVGS